MKLVEVLNKSVSMDSTIRLRRKGWSNESYLIEVRDGFIVDSSYEDMELNLRFEDCGADDWVIEEVVAQSNVTYVPSGIQYNGEELYRKVTK